MPAIITKGAFSAQGYGFGASAATGATYIEDVFSTYLYTGTNATQTITNGIDLSTKGGLVWIKDRSSAQSNFLFDTARGRAYALRSNTTNGQLTADPGYDLVSFDTAGFTLGPAFNGGINISGATFASWTFRKQPKFFDVVTYTGNGSTQTINHNLGSVPGMMIVKSASASGNWYVYHTSLGNSQVLLLNGTQGAYTGRDEWNNTTPTSTTFSVKGSLGTTNNNGVSYVAYLFAHNAGGFGAAGTDNVISCGSYTGNGSATGPAVTLGYEPQYVMVKCTSTTGNWVVLDVMRGMSQTASNELFPNLSSAETALNPSVIPTATGFTLGTTNADLNTNGATYIYMAIRRGPMKTPTDATKVFSPNATSATTGTTITTNFPVDLQIMSQRAASGKLAIDRLRGISTNTTESSVRLNTTLTDAEGASPGYALGWDNLGFKVASPWSGISSIYWSFARAPGFFDEVCYTGTGASLTVNHNLGVSPTLIIEKRRNSTGDWNVGVFLSNFADSTAGGYLNGSSAFAAGFGNNYFTNPTATTFTIPYTGASVNDSGGTYVAYLFATLAGVSKVGSYTGTGAAQNIDCGFAASARFILIKRTDSTGGWFVYDSARGISASNDPYLLLNSPAAEVTTTNYVGTYASGFALTSTAPAALNANGGSFIFLAVA